MLASIFGKTYSNMASIILTSKEFGMIYFFYQISRLSIYIKISALFGWDRRIFYSWKVVIFGINHWQMNLVMFWCSGVATPELYLAISRFYWSIILWWFCWLRVPLFRIFPCWLWWRLFSYCVQLMGNILWLIMEGFGYPYSLAHYGRFWFLPWRASSPIWWL